jgi:hypothetical protein
MNFSIHRKECGWNGVDKKNQFDMGGAGNSQEDCLNFCENDPICEHAFFRPISVQAPTTNGHCHTFETCTGEYGVYQDWAYFTKSCPRKFVFGFL